jgi:carbamoylphosphate synthase large subunit
MLTGVEILLERMKTNPEEFLGIEGLYSKWGRVMAMGRDFFTEEERIALDNGLIGAKREAFNGEVLRVLSGGDSEPSQQYAISSSAMMNIKPSRLITTESLVREAAQTLNAQFDKEYAKKGF